MRSLCFLPGGLGSVCALFLLGLFVVGFVILVGQRCGHGLTSRPRKSASERFLNELLGLFGYPFGSARALLAGALPLRYCTGRFAGGIPTWRLPVFGQVARLVTAVIEACGANGDEVSRREVQRVCGFGLAKKMIRLNKTKTLHTSLV